MANKSKPVTMEEVNRNWDDWWNSLTDSQKQKLVEEQCDDTPLITADGSRIDPYKVSSWNWIAVSQHMLTRNGGPLNYGDTVYILGTEHKDGVYVIKDCMNKRKTNQIDFLESLGTPQYRYDNVVIARFPQENLDS